MFGYIFPDKPELKIKEFELFRAYYCGLCKTISESIGQIPRLVLNYDSSFLGMFLSSFKSETESIKLERCIAHPFNKKHVIKYSPILQYAADMNIILAYYKLKDDWEDNKSIKALALREAILSGFKKARLRNTNKENEIRQRLFELSMLEKKGLSSVDEAAEPFALLTGELFAYPAYCECEENEKKLRWFGYNIGKWIYVLDAYDDIERDIKSKSYNPLVLQFEYDGKDILLFKNSIKDNIHFTLTYTLSEAGKVFETMDIKKNRTILENIIYGGMYNKTLQILG